MTSLDAAPADSPAFAFRGGIWGRQLGRYPLNGPRAFYLGIVVVATIVLYYALYVQGSVATRISVDLDMSLTYFITISIIGNALGALASVLAGLADRWGRANIVVYGVGLVGLIVLFGLANATNKLEYLILFGVVSFVEGAILVATPALIRDFSPQLGRASAMGFWTLGPVLGSLIVTVVSSSTLDSHPDWQFQFRVCGIVTLAVFVLALVGLRELAPQLRDQLMISLRERALIEARARGISPERALSGHWRQMLRADIIGPAAAISVFLLFYYIAVGLFVVFYATVFGYTEVQANSLGNWYWGSQAIALIITGLLSDWLKVRKPFMIVGGIVSAIGVALFAVATGDPTTTYGHFVWVILLIAVGGAVAFAAWMAAFTETVEHHNPAATATGLAVWGATLRLIVVVALTGLIFAIPASSLLVAEGARVQSLVAGLSPDLTPAGNATVKAVAADPTIVPRVQAAATKYQAELRTAAKLDPATSNALAKNPDDPAAQVKALSEISGQPEADVAKVVTLGAQYRDELATAAALSPQTQQALSTNPADTAAQGQAVGEIASKLGVDQAAAVARLSALGRVPATDLAFLSTSAKPVQEAVTALTALGAVPAADLALLSTHGKELQDPKVVAALTYLQTTGPKVQQAQADAPGQWQRWWWICFAGQLVFLPFVWALRGRWRPSAARADAQAHDVAIGRELTALEAARAG